MTKRILLVALLGAGMVIGLLLATELTAYAQALVVNPPPPPPPAPCFDSPENPTWILAGIGTVAAGIPWLRDKLGRRHGKHNHNG